ncbi:RDD family protein [Streptomyces sp. SYSU K217416]
MSTDPPPPGQPPEDDPFLKKPPPEQPPPAGGSPYDTPPGTPPGPGSPYGGGGGVPPPPYDPYGGGGGYGPPDPLSGMPPLADFGKRLVARIIDALIIAIPLALIQIPFTSRFNLDGDDDASEVFVQSYSGTGLLFTLIGIVAFIGYDTLMVKKSGQTVGKKLLNLRVAMLNDGSTPDTNASLMRATVLWLPALLCCPCIWEIVLAITILTDKPYKQGLHDKAGKTVVVTSN